MTRASAHTSKPRPHRRLRRVLPAVATAATAGLLAAGCGGSPTSPGANKQIGQPKAATQAIAYARCMRSHGVSNFPDPTITRSGNHVGVGVSVPGSVSGSPAYKTAQQACARLAVGDLAGGGAAPITAQQHSEIVRFAACMRSHGVPNLPDADATGTFHLVGINTNSPAFTTALKTCQIQGMPLNITSQQGSGSQ